MLKSPDSQELRQLLKKVREVEIRSRKTAESLLSGGYRTVLKGTGIEFEEVREYNPGDDVRSIDWNVTARMNKIFVKKYREEREMAVVMLVDVSASQFFGTRNMQKKDLAVELCAVLALSALKSKDKVGLALFDTSIRSYLPPAKGKPYVMRIIRELLAAGSNSSGTDIAGALNYINRVTKRKSYVFVVSDFFDEEFWIPFQMASRKHDVVPVVLRDAFEQAIPGMGVMPFEDAESGRLCYVDTSSKRFRADMQAQAQRADDELRRKFLKYNAEPVFLHTDSDYIPVLMNYFKRRAGHY